MNDNQIVHILAYTLRGGDATSDHIIDLAQLLMAQGMDVKIFVSYGVGTVPPNIEAIAQQCHYGAYPGGADLTILQYPLWFPLAEVFRIASGTKIFWYHGVTPPSLWPPAEMDIVRNGQIRTELVWYSHLAVATSPFTARELQSHSGYPLEQIEVVPLGVNLEQFAATPSENEQVALRQKWHLRGKRILLYVGRVAKNKRIDLLIDAFHRLTKDFPDLALLLVGDTQDGGITQELTAALQAQARSLGVADIVHFTGRVAEVIPYYHLADVYVQASQHEGLGLPLIEAMAAGVPVVASASGAMPWLLATGEPDAKPVGLLFAENDVDDLVRQLETVLTNQELSDSMIEAGRRHIGQFSIQQFHRRAQEVVDKTKELGQSDPNRGLEPSSGRLLELADVAIRDYQIRSQTPVAGRLIERVRAALTVHMKEAYLDRIVEQQVNYNRSAAHEIQILRQEIAELRAEIARLQCGSSVDG